MNSSSNKFIYFLVLSIFIFSSCEEDIENGASSQLSDEYYIEPGLTGSVSDYFYDLFLKNDRN